MSYPSPSIYTYRVVGVESPDPGTGENGYFVAEFSTNSGTTWLPLFQTPFTSKTEAFQAIAKLLGDEAKFQKQYLQVVKFNNPKVVPTRTVYSYPPA